MGAQRIDIDNSYKLLSPLNIHPGSTYLFFWLYFLWILVIVTIFLSISFCSFLIHFFRYLRRLCFSSRLIIFLLYFVFKKKKQVCFSLSVVSALWFICAGMFWLHILSEQWWVCFTFYFYFFEGLV